jgi:hypothetical protein
LVSLNRSDEFGGEENFASIPSSGSAHLETFFFCPWQEIALDDDDDDDGSLLVAAAR